MCIRDRVCRALKQAGVQIEYVAGVGLAAGRTLQPVSYTHLDVYKRQVQDAVRHRRVRRMEGPLGRHLRGLRQARGLSLIHIYERRSAFAERFFYLLFTN